MTTPLSVPIAFLVFNRPELTEATFARIREQRPGQIFIIGDGPRRGQPTDLDNIERVQEVVARVDWECSLKQDFARQNMGLYRRITSGLEWVFSQVDEAIILEDDCLAEPSFFSFCSELLDIYRDDHRVGMISGDNFQDGQERGRGSYYFSKYAHCWGWATWARAWQTHDATLDFWPAYQRSSDWEELMPDPIERQYWNRIMDRARAGRIDSWAYRWAASCFRNGLLTATPNVNLVRNIGFGPDATNTKRGEAPTAKSGSLSVVVHPSEVQRDLEAERYDFDHVYGGQQIRERRRPRGFFTWVLRGIRRRLPSLSKR